MQCSIFVPTLVSEELKHTGTRTHTQRERERERESERQTISLYGIDFKLKRYYSEVSIQTMDVRTFFIIGQITNLSILSGHKTTLM